MVPLERFYPLEPPVRLGDHRVAGVPSWTSLDRASSEITGRDTIALPSVRVGLAWVLEYLRFVRHADHVLVPRFTSHCILGSVSRHALPVEEPTARTRLVLVVHQFGFRQDLEAIDRACAEHGWRYVEDAAFGPDVTERLGPGSVARFIGLTKTLPVVKGALLIADDPQLIDFVRAKRRRAGPLSWAVFAALAVLRSRPFAVGSSEIADAAYQLYHLSGGDGPWTRGNIAVGLARLDMFASESSRRRDLVRAALTERVLVSDGARLPYVAAYLPFDGATPLASACFAREGFSPDMLHVDLARNVLAPRYERAFLIPLHARVPRERFDALIDALRTARA